MKLLIFKLLISILMLNFALYAKENKSSKIAYQNAPINENFPINMNQEKTNLLIEEPKEKENNENNNKSDNFDNLEDFKTLTFCQLLKNKDIERDNHYRGSFFPIRIFRTPGKVLNKNKIKNHKMVMMNTDKVSERLFILVPENQKNEVRKMIRRHKKIDIVYKRIGIFNSKYPLLQLVKNVELEKN